MWDTYTMSVRTIALTLRPSAEQAVLLERLRQQFNAACTYFSQEAWAAKEFRQFPLHPLVYETVREQFGLLAQHTIRAIAVVASSYKADRTHQHTFRFNAAVVLDTPRLYRLRSTLASIATLDGRIEVPLAIGGKQREQLAAATKLAEADLIRDDKGRWRLLVSAHYPDPPLVEPTDVLGVDLGMVNIAADSEGTVYSGAQLRALRRRHGRLRKRLQMRHTASARKLRRKRRKRESHFASDVNHCISKRIVAAAERTSHAIAVEDLGGIRERVTASRSQRATLHSWSFHQLRSFIEYKARMAGVLVVPVDPRNSSRTCPSCGCIHKRNRLSQSCFSCVSCGFSGLADTIAATVLRQRGQAAVNLPYIPFSGVLNAGGTSPRALAVGS
jgi:IS605 OrfB family transposase